MLTLAATESIQGVCSAATTVTYTINGMERTVATGAEAFRVLGQGQLPAVAGALYTVGAGLEGLVKTIMLSNTGATNPTVTLSVNGTAAANRICGPIPMPANGYIVISDVVQIFDATGYLIMSTPLATFLLPGIETAEEKIQSNSLDGKTSTGTTKRVFRPGDYMIGNTFDPTGALDSTSSFSAMMGAYNGLADRAIIELPPGVFKVNPGVFAGFPTAPGRIRGSGRGTTVLIPNATGDFITLASGVDGYALEEFAIYNTGAPFATGAGINTNGADSVTIDNMLFVNLFYDIHCNNTSIKTSIQRTLHSQTNGNASSVGIYVNNGLAGDTYIGPDVVMSNTGATRRRASVEIVNCGHYELNQCNLTGSAQGVLIDPGAGQIVAFGFHDKLLCDSNTVNGMTLNAATATSTIKNIKSSNSWYSGTVAGTGAAGVLTTGTAGGIINGVTHSMDRFLNNQTHGYQHGFGTDFRWGDCDMKGNSAAGSAVSDGLNVAAAVSNWSINGGKYGGTDTVPTAGNQRYGIFVAAGAGNNINIGPDDLTGNVTGPISMGATGASVFVRPCPGMSPSASRVANIAIANTETVVLSITIPANSVRAGAAFQVEGGGLWNNTAANTTSTLRIRVGTTTLTGAIPQGLTIQCGATARTNIPFTFRGVVTIASIGAGGTVTACLSIVLPNVVAPIIAAVTTALTGVAINTTVNNLLEITYISGLAGNTVNFTNCTIVPLP